MEFIKNLANLIKVKTIVTLMVLAVFTILSLRGDIAPDNVMMVVTTVIAFYFGTQHEKRSEEDGKYITYTTNHFPAESAAETHPPDTAE